MAFQFPDPSVTPEFTGANGITYSWDATDGKWVVKSFAAEDIIGDCATSEDTVCDQLEQLKLGLVEVEEEIESIAPALERGVWLYEQQSNVIRPPNPARYFLLKGYTIGDPLLTGVEFTEEYGEADAVVFSNTEWNLDDENGLGGSTHDWGTVEVGEIIDLFDKPDNDGLFGKITEINDQIYGDDSILIAFDRIETLNGPTNKEPYLTRLKIFKEPTGGDANEFVRKRGDDMTGRLKMNIRKTVNEVNYAPPTAKDEPHLLFRYDRTSTGGFSEAKLYQPGFSEDIVASSNFSVRKDLYAQEYIKAAYYTTDPDTGRQSRNVKEARIRFFRNDDVDYGSLRHGNQNIFNWNAEEAIAVKPIKINSTAAPTAPEHVVPKSYIDQLVQVAGLQLGRFTYRRSGDSFFGGHIKSNTTTNPQNITWLQIHKTNADGIEFGTKLYEEMIREKMWLHFRDKSNAHYVGQITSIESISNGIKLYLNTISGETYGTTYVDSSHYVSIGYNRYGIAFPNP